MLLRDTVQQVLTTTSTRHLTARRRRGFSLAEVAIAATLFLVVATVVSLISAKALSARATMAGRARIEAQLETALDELARGDFDNLLQNDFTPPQACPGSLNRGTLGESCLTVGGVALRGTWSSSITKDSAGDASGATDGVELRVSVAYDANSTVTRTRVVPAPNPGYDGQGVVRIRFSGAVAGFEGPVYLLDRSTNAVRGSANVSSSGVALVRITSGACSTQSPCRVALSPASYTTNGTVHLAAANVLGPGSYITAPSGTITQVGVDLMRAGRFVFSVAAEGDVVGGVTPRAKPTTKDTVCLFVRFSDGVATREAPVCNDTQGDMTLATYQPDPADPTLSLAIPEGAVGTIAVDRTNAVCGAPGQLGATPTGWQQRRVCTSWTWGVPGIFDTGASRATLANAAITASSAGTNAGTVLFTGALARPAAGYAGQPLWSNPREAGACAESNSCVSLGVTVPETTVCPGQQCLAVRQPKLTAPLQGVGQVPGVNRNVGVTAFTVTVSDDGGDPVAVSVPVLPRAGVLTHIVNVAGTDVRTTVTAGALLETTAAGGGVVRFEYNDDGATPLEWFTLRIANSLPNGSRDVDVALWREAGVFSVASSEARMRQGAAGTVPLTVLAADGTVAAGQSVFLSAPAGLSVPASATVASTGRVDMPVTVGAAPAGPYTVTVTTGAGRAFTVPIIVEQTAGSLASAAVGSVSQGGSVNWTVSAADLSGAPMSGALISADVIAGDGSVVRGVYGVPRGCATDSTGSCSMVITADAGASAGSYTLRGTSGTFTTTKALTVVSTITTVGSTTTATLAQGTTTAASVLVTDGAGKGLAGVTVTATPTAALTIAAPTATTGADGRATFAITATSSAPVGPTALSVSAGTTVGAVALEVTGAPKTLTAASSVSVVAGSTATFSVSVADGAGNPAPGARIAGTVAGGVATIVATRTASDGSVNVSVSAADTAAIGPVSGTIQLLDEAGTVIATRPVTVTVAAAPKTITLNGRGERGRTVDIPLSVTNGQGGAVGGALVVASGLPAGVSIMNATTAADGTATVSVSVGTTKEGTYLINMTATIGATQRTVKVPLTIYAPATNATGPGSVPLSRGSTTYARVLFTAADGSVADMAPTAATAAGTPLVVSSTPTDGFGGSQISITAGADSAAGTYTVRVTSGTAVLTFSVVVS